MDETSKQNASAIELNEIKRLLQLVNNKVDNQDARIRVLEQQAVPAKSAEKETPYVTEEAKPEANSLSEAERRYIESLHENDLSKTTPAAGQVMNFEERIGGNVFAKIGMIALILGISFFLKYAFDNNWINEAGRVILGIIAGLVLLGIGEKTIRKYSAYGQLLSGGGIGVLYLSIYSALNFYHLIDQIPAFVLMAFITAAGIFLSFRYNSIGLISFSIIGGFATPFLVSSGTNQQVALFGYVLLLDLAILFVSFFKKWRELNLIGFIGTAIVFASWMSEFYTKDQLLSTFLFLTSFLIIYSISSLIYNILKKEPSSGSEQALMLLTASGYFMAGYFLLNADFHDITGLFTFSLALYFTAWAFLIRQNTPEDENLYSFLVFLIIGFVTLAIPIQFNKNIITLAWTFEALVLFFINIKARVLHRIPFFMAITVYGLVLFRLLVLDSQMDLANPMFILNERFFTFFAVIAVSYLIAVLIYYFLDEQITDRKIEFQQIIIILIIAANFLTIFSVSQEIIDSYEIQIAKKMTEQSQQLKQQNQVYGYRGNYRSDTSPTLGNNYQAFDQDIKDLKNKRDISLSIFWLIYAIIVMAVGFTGKYKTLRFGGLLLLLLAISKLFFYDLWSLGTLYRIISSISLGVVLLSISFAYQKYKDKLKVIITE